MKVKKVLMAVYIGLCNVFAAVFYVLFKQKKDEEAAARTENENLKKEIVLEQEKTAAAEAKTEQIQTVQEKYTEGLKEIEQTKEKLNSNSASDAIAASDQLLESLRQKGRARNRNQNNLQCS